MPIPKRIHQTVRNKKKLHPLLLDNIARLRALNPGWRYDLYDDCEARDFIAAHYGPRILDYFKRINPIYGPAKADLFRYLLLYKLGGVYLDVKSGLTQPLSEQLADGDYLLSRWKNKPGQRYQGWGLHAGLDPGGEFQQWHIVCAPEHPFLAAVIQTVMQNIDNYDPYLQGTGKAGVVRVTGPVAYTLAISPIRLAHPHAVVDIEQFGFVYSVTGGPGHELSHEALFPGHYRHSREPIVRERAVDLTYRTPAPSFRTGDIRAA